jgi:hypothetical protein
MDERYLLIIAASQQNTRTLSFYDWVNGSGLGEKLPPRRAFLGCAHLGRAKYFFKPIFSGGSILPSDFTRKLATLETIKAEILQVIDQVRAIAHATENVQQQSMGWQKL